MQKVVRKVKPQVPVPADIDIAQSIVPLPISAIAEGLGLKPEHVSPYGHTRAKVKLDVLKELKERKSGKYVVVTAMNPTPLGEGKSTTTIGLCQSLGAHLGVPTIACIRQPSQGPTFGIKGGAAGGGYSQVIPMEEFNLHGTGDIHAISAANNLLAAAIDTRIFHEATQTTENLYKRLTDDYKDFTPIMKTRLRKLGIDDKADPKALTEEERSRFSRLNIDPSTVSWRRVVDCNDRMLRQITIGQGPEESAKAAETSAGPVTRTTGFDIAVASEVMAILALSTDLMDMRRRFGDIQVALDKDGNKVTAEDIGCAGAMTVLMKDAIEPTLMQTLEGTPCLVHTGPFGNIAHGNSSIVADNIALKLVGEKGVVLTEAGFGADMGCEKFFNIKCRASGLAPDCAVIVATIRALKFHGGVAPADAKNPNMDALKAGISNLLRHIDNVAKFGVNAVVVLNRFTDDLDEEIAFVLDASKRQGAAEAVCSTHWATGGEGAMDAANAVLRACDAPKPGFKLLYPNEMALKDKILTICREVYGAADVSYGEGVLEKLAQFEAMGYKQYPICMAKTQYSFSHDPAKKGAPSGFTVPIRDVRVNCGAKFVFPLLGQINTLPGLPIRPAYYRIDIDEEGRVVGLS